MSDAHLAEHLNCCQPPRQVVLGEGARLQDPRSKHKQGGEVLRERGCGLVVNGDAQVGINLGKGGLWAVKHMYLADSWRTRGIRGRAAVMEMSGGVMLASCIK